MEFGSLIFLFLFLPIFLFFYFISPLRIKKIVLMVFSLLFYYFVAGNYAGVLILSILFNFFMGDLIEKLSVIKKRRLALTFGIIVNVFTLIYFKYMAFFLSGIISVKGLFFSGEIATGSSSFPVGISFYTFIAISYLTDIYRKNAAGFSKISDIALSFTMFPKLLAGPITLHSKFSRQITLERRYLYDFDEGVKRVIIGLGKKVLIADYLSGTANDIFNIPNGMLTFSLAWLGAITYTLTLYLDFSGYSDIAIGLGKILGYDIPENFNFPYISRSIKEFWKRWHISLSEWLQTYLFLPIAYWVMRKIEKDTFFKVKTENVAYISSSFITMVICGLWHGAAWTFVFWGVFHGSMLIIEHNFLKRFLKKKRYFLLQWFYAQIVIISGWVIFRSSGLDQIKDFMFSMVGFGQGSGIKYSAGFYINAQFVWILFAGIIVSFPIFNWIKQRLSGGSATVKIVSGAIESLSLLVIFILSIMAIAGGTYNPFIYFRF